MSLQGDLGVISELEIKVKTTGLEGVEEQRMGRFDGKIVEYDEDFAICGILGGEGIAKKWKNRD